jgi:hypothetical protein
MPRKPKALSEQSKRFIEMAEEIGAETSEEEFRRKLKLAISPKIGAAAAKTSKLVPKSRRR